MTGFTNPILYMFADEDLDLQARTPLACKYSLPYNGRQREAAGKKISMDEGYQFSHTLETQLGSQKCALSFCLRRFMKTPMTAAG